MKIAIIQSKWSDRADENLKMVQALAEGVCGKEEKIDFLCLPEFFLGPPWFQPGQAHLKGITDDTIPGRVTDIFQKIAREHGTYIVCGTIIEREGDKYYNTSTFIDKNGKILEKARKIHTFAGESIACEAGNKFLTYETDFGLVGIAICSDFWIQETCRILAVRGAKIIFIPGGSLEQNLAPMIAAIQATAYLNSVIVVYASPIGKAVGKRGDRMVSIEYAGCSLIVSPKEILAKGSIDKIEVLTAGIADDYIDKLRKPNDQDDTWKGLAARHPEYYGELTSDYVHKDRDLNREFRKRIGYKE